MLSQFPIPYARQLIQRVSEVPGEEDIPGCRFVLFTLSTPSWNTPIFWYLSRPTTSVYRAQGALPFVRRLLQVSHLVLQVPAHSEPVQGLVSTTAYTRVVHIGRDYHANAVLASSVTGKTTSYHYTLWVTHGHAIYNTKMRSVRVTTVVMGKSVSTVLHILNVFVAVVIQHAKRMCHVILSSVVSLALPYFCTLSHKSHDFREKKLLAIKCGLFLYNFCLKHFSV